MHKVPVRLGVISGVAFLVFSMAGPATAIDLRAACAQAKQRAGGWRVCARAIKAHPKDAVLRRNYARSLSFSGHYDAALIEYQFVARMQPNSANAQYELSYFMGFIQHFKAAEGPIEKALALSPNNLRYLKHAAIIYANNRNGTKRFAVVSKAAGMNDLVSIYELSTLYLDGIGTAKNREKGLRWLRRAANRGHVLAMDNLAAAYLNGRLGLPKDRRMADHWARRAHRARHGQ